MSTGSHIAFMMYSSKINDVHETAVGMNDLLNIELCNDNLNMVDRIWEETLMAMDIELYMAS